MLSVDHSNIEVCKKIRVRPWWRSYVCVCVGRGGGVHLYLLPSPEFFSYLRRMIKHELSSVWNQFTFHKKFHFKKFKNRADLSTCLNQLKMLYGNTELHVNLMVERGALTCGSSLDNVINYGLNFIHLPHSKIVMCTKMR